MIDTTKKSTNVTAGTNATADQYNGIRADMGTGWLDPEITPVYSSVTAQIGVITVPTDATTLFEIGDKIRFKQGGGYKYFKVVIVTSTTLSITGGSEYTLTNAVISDFYLSKWVSPVDFPLADDILVTVTCADTTAFDVRASKDFEVTLDRNPTLTLSNAKKGDIIAITLIQDATGSRTVSWFSTISWAGGSAPLLITTATKADTFIFICTGTNTYRGYFAGQNI